MKFEDYKEGEVIDFHLSLETKIDENTIAFSSLFSLLRDCRTATGRNIENGQRDRRNDRSDNWLGAIGYLTALDQIGKCYKLKHKAITFSNSISKALESFTKLSPEQINAIYALRCSFAHDYSLFNIGKKGKGLTHHFTVTGHGYSELIRLPKLPWDGNHKNKSFENMTIINLPLFTDLVEDIITSLSDYYKNGYLELIISSKELWNRYLFFSHGK